MGWLIFLTQLANPLVGTTGAVPLAIGLLKLPPPAVLAVIVPVNLLQIALMHWAWQALLRRPRVHAWIEARRSPRVAGWLDRRGAFLAAAVATFVVGSIPTYVSLRYLGVPFGGRIWGGVAIGAGIFGLMVTGAAALAWH